MTAIRRITTVLGLTVAVIAFASLPASATYSSSTTVRTTTIATATVAAPTQVEAKATCTTAVDPATGATTTTVEQAKVEWHASATVGVSGYRVTVHLANGASTVVAQTGATADEIFPDVDHAYLSQQPRYSVTTLTRYGWTAVSAKTGVLSC